MTMLATVAANGSSWWARHGLHTLLIALPTIVIGGIGLRADLQARAARNGRTHRNRSAAVLLAGAFSLGAAVVHGTVCSEHFKEATIYGVFFLVTASCQGVWAVLVWTRPRRWLLAAGAAANAVVIALWAYTRTVGVPLGPGRGETEAIGKLDVIATTCEVGIVVFALIALVTVTARTRAPHWPHERAAVEAGRA